MCAAHWRAEVAKKLRGGYFRGSQGCFAQVAKKLGVDCYETPTGWKFFGNLMDAGG